MARKKKKEPQRPVRVLYPPTDLEQDMRYLPARASVLGTVELLEHIFSYMLQIDLILNAQGVCRQWRDIVPGIPETYLDKVPPVEPGLNPAQQFNPLLFKHFRAMFGVEDQRWAKETRKAELDLCGRCQRSSYYLDMSGYYKLGCFPGCEKHVHGMSISITASATTEHRKFTRHNASWRQMQLASPPITKVRYKGFDGEVQMVTVPEGLRMGALYDLLVYGALIDVEKRYHMGIKIEWVARPRQRRRESWDSESNDDNSEPPDNTVDEIHIEKFRCFHYDDVRLRSLIDQIKVCVHFYPLTPRTTAARGLAALLALAATVSAGPVHSKRGTSTIWCGPVLAGQNFKTVEASWVIPNVSYPADANKNEQYFSSQWVGIDGTNGCKGLLQAGTSQGLDQGEIWHYSWVEFYPAEAGEIDLEFSIGDTVYVKVTATSKTTGTVYMHNNSTGKSATKDLKAPSGAELCFEHVEWIEEDPGGGLPFPAFETYSFTGAAATDSKGHRYNLKGSESFDMVQDGQTLCSPTIKSDTSVQFEYKGKR